MYDMILENENQKIIEILPTDLKADDFDLLAKVNIDHHTAPIADLYAEYATPKNDWAPYDSIQNPSARIDPIGDRVAYAHSNTAMQHVLLHACAGNALPIQRIISDLALPVLVSPASISTALQSRVSEQNYTQTLFANSSI